MLMIRGHFFQIPHHLHLNLPTKQVQPPYHNTWYPVKNSNIEDEKLATDYLYPFAKHDR